MAPINSGCGYSFDLFTINILLSLGRVRRVGRGRRGGIGIDIHLNSSWVVLSAASHCLRCWSLDGGGPVGVDGISTVGILPRPHWVG